MGSLDAFPDEKLIGTVFKKTRIGDAIFEMPSGLAFQNYGGRDDFAFKFDDIQLEEILGGQETLHIGKKLIGLNRKTVFAPEFGQ